MRCYITGPSGSLAHAAQRKLKKDCSDNDHASSGLKRQFSNKPACLHKLSSSSSSLNSIIVQQPVAPHALERYTEVRSEVRDSVKCYQKRTPCHTVSLARRAARVKFKVHTPLDDIALNLHSISQFFCNTGVSAAIYLNLGRSVCSSAVAAGVNVE